MEEYPCPQCDSVLGECSKCNYACCAQCHARVCGKCGEEGCWVCFAECSECYVAECRKHMVTCYCCGTYYCDSCVAKKLAMCEYDNISMVDYMFANIYGNGDVDESKYQHYYCSSCEYQCQECGFKSCKSCYKESEHMNIGCLVCEKELCALVYKERGPLCAKCDLKNLGKKYTKRDPGGSYYHITDVRIKKLLEEKEQLQKEITQLRAENEKLKIRVKYMPQGEGYLEAKRHFKEFAQRINEQQV